MTDKANWMTEYEEQLGRTTGIKVSLTGAGGGWYQLVCDEGHQMFFGHKRKKEILDMTAVLMGRPDYGVDE